MKRFFNIFAIALASVLMFSCQEDADVDNFGFGGTVKGKFSLVVPSNEMVEITRATEEQESDVTSVHLFFFDHNSKDALGNESVTLGTATQSGNYTRTYNITTAKSFADGQVVDIYAIANTESSLGNVADFTAVANNHTEFTKLLMSLELLNTPFSTMTMSGKLEGVVASQQFGLTGNIQVKRPYAKVNFTIKNGNSNFTFTPTQYNVKNVPTSGAVFEGGVASEVKFKNYDGMTDFVENQGAQVIEFYMLENKAGKAEGVANYNDRELRKDVNGGKHEEFAHGLANATYVEILGEGKGTNAKGEPISATVKYTIHLGDFTADATDFNVNRNTFYNYTVTVNGVENIVVEAESEAMDDEKFQHGAEGTVINLEGSTMVYTLDAHYEQVLLNLNLTALPTKDNDVVLVVSTPYMDEANKGAMITWSMIESTDFGSKFDTEWVEFYPSNALCAYPSGNSNLMKTVDFLKWIKQQKANGVTSLSVVAYINEYFYNSHPLDSKKEIHWSDFVNKEDRVMRILQEPQISKDGHSISTKALCSFTQRSIRTFFNENTEGAYGMEWYEEINTPLTSFSYNGTSSTNGLINFTAQSMNNKINYANVGYGNPENGQVNGNVYSSLSMSDAGFACLARNRSTSDIKWYPAAPNQYVAYWFGEASIPNDAKLYKGNPAENLTSADGWNDGGYEYLHHYWTSGPDATKIFWAIEGAAFCPGRYRTYYGANGSEHKVRCLRNFDSSIAEPAEAQSITTKENQTATAIVIKNFNDNAYRGIATQRLPIHHERDAANKVSKAFIIARNNLNATWTTVSDAPSAPQIVSVTSSGNNIVVKFVEKDTYAVATGTGTNSTKTTIELGAENSYTFTPDTRYTYYFYTKRNYNTYSGYVKVAYTNGVWTADNTVTGNGSSFSVTGNTSTNKIPLMVAIYQDICASYTAESANGTAWRVPNQRELLAMYTLGISGINANTHSSTLYSARNIASTSDNIRYGYVWFYTGQGSDGYGLQSYNWGITGSHSTDYGYVRCVRDASEAELQSLGISNSGDQEDGGNPMLP